VTGASGFIGSHLVPALKREGHDVYLLSRGDDVLKTLKTAKPELTYHLASLFLAENSYEQVKPLVESNILLGTELVDALVRENCRAIVCAGTAWQNFEGKKGTAACLYAATKEAFESVLRYYADAQALRACVLKLYDTYGPQDKRRKLLSLIRESVNSSKPMGLSPGDQKIDLLHVNDAISAFLTAGARVREPGPGRLEEFYLRSGRVLSIKELANLVNGIKTFEARFGERPYRAREVMNPWTQGETLPGWNPRVTLEAGLKEYLEERIDA
jgi:nucleoside-diphosphate-sugar epimerase